MTHIGLTCPTLNSHLTQICILGNELKMRGHRVTFIGPLDAAKKVESAGLEFCAVGRDRLPLGRAKALQTRIGEAVGLEAFRYTAELFREEALSLLEEAPEAMQKLGVELFIVDQVSFAGSTVADRLGIPFITTCAAIALEREPAIPPFSTTWSHNDSWWAQIRNRCVYQILEWAGKPLLSVLAEYRQRWQLPPYRNPNDPYSSLARICQQPKEFDFPRQELPAWFHYTGPYANPSIRKSVDFPYDHLTGAPLIYASLGTVQNQVLGTFEAIAAACEGLDVQLVIALGGGRDPGDLPSLPGDPIVVGFAPQLELLKRATLTITHAGLNTALESLANGVPMVAIPIANDQPGVAARIVWTGTGELVPLRGLTVAKLRRAVTKVLSEPS